MRELSQSNLKPRAREIELTNAKSNVLPHINSQLLCTYVVTITVTIMTPSCYTNNIRLTLLHRTQHARPVITNIWPSTVVILSLFVE